MATIEDAMNRLQDVNGFLAVGAFSPAGELLAEVSKSNVNLAEIGALANDVLLKSQKSTDIMGVGRGNMIHIMAPRAQILVRCLNENPDFATSAPGHAHVHMVLVLAADGSIALGKLQLEKVILEVAEHVR